MLKQSIKFSHKQLITLILLVFGILQIHSQCPTITNTNQSFCDLDGPTISDLVATDNGNGVVWYDTPISTTPIGNTEGLISGEDYYADDNSGTCGTRERVDVLIYGAPLGLNFQGVCVDDMNDATISDLNAVGNNVQWYNVPSDGVALPSTTILNDNTIYYADQENPDTNCRTSRLSVLVNIGLVPVPTGDVIQEFCSDEIPTVADLVAIGSNNWYANLGSVIPLELTEPLINGENYFATSVDPPCESDSRLEVTVIINTPANSGANGTLEICETDINTILSVDLIDSLLGNPDTDGSWSGPLPTTNGSTGTLDITSLTVNGGPYVFTYEVDSATVCGINTSTVTITIIPPPNAGTDGVLDVCTDNDPIDLFTLLGGSPETGGTWSPLLASGPGLFDPSTDTAGVYTYTIAANPPCEDSSATVTVTTNIPPNPGTNATVDLCTNNDPIDLFTVLGGSPETDGTWSPTLASGTGFFDPALDTAGTYTYTLIGTPPCEDQSATVTVDFIPTPNAGTDGVIDLCTDNDPIDLFTLLGGSPETGGTWSPLLASGPGLFDPSTDTAGVYTYTIAANPPCEDSSATVTVTTNIPRDPGINAVADLCNNGGAINLFTLLGGTPETGGTWSPALASGTGLFNPNVDFNGTYTYTLTGTPPCGDQSATVTVTIILPPDAGEDSNAVICIDDGAQNLFNYINGTPDSGGTWSPALASGTGLFDPNVDIAGIYTYTVNGPIACNQSDTSTVTVTIETSPDATGLEISSEDICLGLSNDISITNATLLVDGPYTLTYNLSGVNQSDNTITINILSGASLFNIPANLLTNVGLTTVTITSITNVGSICSADVSAILTSSFTVLNSLTPELIENGNIFCLQDEPTIENLSSNIINTEDITWYDAPNNGNSYANDESLVDGQTYYASALSDDGCESTNRLEVTVIFENCPLDIIIPDGFSPNDDTINDEFTIENLRDLYPNFTLEIYNRYGNILYKGDINTRDWDGTSEKGITLGDSKLPVGVYFFILEFNDGNRNPIQGRVYLSR